MSKGVKRLIHAIKTSVNYSQALIGVVSKLHWASTFLRRSSSFSKRLWKYSLASNYIKPVLMIHLTMSTYTFNYYYPMGDNVDGEIRKKRY